MSTTRAATRAAERWGRLRPLADPMLVLALTAFTLATMPQIDDASAAYRDTGLPAVVLVCVAAAATAIRHHWPVQAVLVAAATVGSYLALSYPYGPVFGFVVLTVYAVARHRRLAHSAVASVVALAMLLFHVPINEAAFAGAIAVVPALAWIAIPFTVGAARRLVVEAGQRERASADARLVDAERLRLSQEVHDVVGHGLAAIQMQADITLHVHAEHPERMRTALETIARASQDALDELRATLASIGPEGDPDAASRGPGPGLARVEELCRRVEEAGVTVDLVVERSPQRLDAAADLAAYRVLQEALTNVVKHSAHQHADVRVRHDARTVTLEITNQDLSPPPADGVGISGMRRRVTQLGGTFRAGPGSKPGTFQVRAAIPRTPEKVAQR